jgi:hypothetical protein
MFLYPPIMRLEDRSERMDNAFKDVLMPVLKEANQHAASWRIKQRKEFRKFAFALRDAELDQVMIDALCATK